MNIPKLPEKPEQDLAPYWFNTWYAELETWHAKTFEGAVEVKAALEDNRIWCASQNDFLAKTHKALLINIQPIKEETAEDIVKDLFWRGFNNELIYGELILRAKAFLERKK